MGKIVILRKRAWCGMGAKMDCYVDERRVCQLNIDEEFSYSTDNPLISFRCQLGAFSPSSEKYTVDLQKNPMVAITVKQGAWKPTVSLSDIEGFSLQFVSDDFGESEVSESSLPPLKFIPTSSVGCYFGINEITHQFAVGHGIFASFDKASVYAYNNLISFELIEDGSSLVTGGLGRAVVGGALFGGIGAIVGGVTASKRVEQKCSSLAVKLTINSTASPIEYINLVTSVVDKSSLQYRSAFASAQKILSLLEIIIHEQEPRNTSHQEVSTADEIRRYKELCDDGIITEDEFKRKKEKLLGF